MSAGPENPTVGVLGCGYWGKNLVRNFRELGALALVADESAVGRDLAATLAPDIRITGDATDLLAAEIDGVVIATQAETHHALAKAALLAGKDVFVEKPLALTYEQGAELVTLAESRQRILMVGHVLEYHPGIGQLLSLVAAGELGRVHYICSNRLSLGKIRREENILWSFAPHDIAIILRLMGELPFQVSASGGAYLQPNIADVTVTHLLFDNGVRAHIYVSWLHPFKEQKLVVIGSKRMASYDDVTRELLLYDQHVTIRNAEPVPVKGEGKAVPFSDEEPLRRECQAFLQAMSSRQAPLTDGPSALRVLKVLQAAQRSLITNGAPIALPGDSHIIGGTML